MQILSTIRESGNISFFYSVRFFSLLFTASCFIFLPRELFYSLFFALGLTHYLGGVVFAGGTMKTVLSNRRRSFLLILAITIGLCLFFAGFPALIFFGIHHIFTEIYMANRYLISESTEQPRIFILSRYLMQTFAYLFLTRYSPDMPAWIPLSMIKIGIVGSFLFFAGVVWLKIFKQKNSGKNLHSVIFYEFVSVLLMIWIGRLAPSQFILATIIFYHGASWYLYPLPKMMQGGKHTLFRYAYLLTFQSLFFVFFTPLILIPGWIHANPEFILDVGQMNFWVIAAGFVHISISFFISNANPSWMRAAVGLGDLRYGTRPTAPVH